MQSATSRAHVSPPRSSSPSPILHAPSFLSPFFFRFPFHSSAIHPEVEKNHVNIRRSASSRLTCLLMSPSFRNFVGVRHLTIDVGARLVITMSSLVHMS